MTVKQVLKAIDAMNQYKSYGYKAARKGAQRKDNPYNLRCDQGHWWDEGWLSGHREKRLEELTQTKEVREYLLLKAQQDPLSNQLH